MLLVAESLSTKHTIGCYADPRMSIKLNWCLTCVNRNKELPDGASIIGCPNVCVQSVVLIIFQSCIIKTHNFNDLIFLFNYYFHHKEKKSSTNKPSKNRLSVSSSEPILRNVCEWVWSGWILWILWCFLLVFGRSFWRHPFTAEDPLGGSDVMLNINILSNIQKIALKVCIH